jgi:hypothetical protein
MGGFREVKQRAAGLWTLEHRNGTVIGISAEAISDEQFRVLKGWITLNKKFLSSSPSTLCTQSGSSGLSSDPLYASVFW